MDYEVKTLSKDEEQIIVPARIELPDVRYDFQDPISIGDEIGISISKNGETLDTLTFTMDTEAEEGNEVRAFIAFRVAEMAAFTQAQDAARILSNSGSVGEKIKILG